MNRAGIAIKALCVAIPLALSCCSKNSTKTNLAAVMKAKDPTTMTLDTLDAHQRRTTLADKTETGILTLGDGSQVKYWFLSHHIAKDMGGTWFLLDSGERIFMAGYFCCEVEIPEASLASSATLKDFIAKHDGIEP